jgi:hypothetical protein
MSTNKPLQIVCIQAGTKYSDEYPNRLQSMLERWMEHPFELTCCCDHDRPLHPKIKKMDCRGWGLEGSFVKLRLFDRTLFPDEFIFIDQSIAIKKSMAPMINFCLESKKEFVAMRDWHYDCLGSAVMLVRPCEMTEGFYTSYRDGKRYPTKSTALGDQDHIDAYIEDHGFQDRVDYIPLEWIATYKGLRKLNETNPKLAKEQLDIAIIVKFHGPPKNEQVLDTWRNFFFIMKRKPHKVFKWYRYLSKELAEWWR